MANRTLKVEIVGDASSFQRALNNASGTSGKFGGTIARMGKLAAAGMAAIGVGAVIAGKRMVSMASDAAEVDSKLDVVFGKALPKLSKNLDTFAEATGASRFQLREQAADMGALLVPLSSTVKGAADMSNQFVQLATDLGSFNNVPVEEALLAIRSGLVGEAEPLRRFGILLNEGSTKATAYSEGIAKVGSELTEQQKVQARGIQIMEQSTLAQGDATRTADSAANQFKALRNNISDAATEMGAKLLPAVLAAVKAFNDNWPQIEKVVDTVMDGIATAVEAGVNAIRTHFGTIKTIATTAFSGAISAVRELADFFGSELGRKLAIGATGFLAVSKAMGGILAAAKLANTGLLLVKANPLWAALIPLGFALGAVAEQFIKSKIEAANAAAAWDAALDASNRLASALSGVKGAQIEVRQATLDARSAHAEHVKSIDASKDALLAYGPQSAQYRGALTAEEQAAINSDRATLRLKDSKAALNEKTGETETISKSASQAILSMAGSMDKASGSSIKSAQLTGLQSKEADAYVKKLGELIPKQEAMAAKYRASEPALANQATKTAELARKLSELAKETDKVPDRKTIIAEAKLIGGPAFAKAVAGIIEGSDKAQKGAKKELDKLPGHVDSAIAAGNREAAGASVIAGTITSGIESGFNFGGIINIVRSGVRAAIAAGANAGSTTKEYAAKEIGKPLSEGPIEQVKKDAPKLAEVTVASVRKAVGAAQLAAAAAEIGGPAVQKIINDIVGKTPSLKAQFAASVREAAEAGKQAIADARQGYADAFAGLYQAGFDAIAAKYDGWVPPALLRKQREAEERERVALEKSITDAQNALQAAIAAGQALPPLKMGEIPSAEFKAAEKAVLDAQKTLDDLLFQQRQKMLDEKAIQQQKDKDKEIADEQASFAKKLKVIMASHRDVNAKVQALLKEFNIDFLKAGAAWGNQLAEGIRSAKKAVGDAAAELAQAAKNNTQNNSPKPKEGPLSKKSMFDAGREHGMNWARGIASAAGAVGKAAATTAGGASGGFGDAKNTGNIFDFGSGTPPPGGFGPDFEGSRPGWADRELWETTAVMAAKLGKFDALIDAVQSGSIKANAGLLSQLFYARTRQTWNDFPARIAKILDDMRGPEGLSSAEAAAKYGLKQGGYTKKDGFAFLHKNEIVTPLPSSGRMSMGSQAININFNGTVMGGTEAQMARVLAPAIENEIRRSQRRGNASIVQAT